MSDRLCHCRRPMMMRPMMMRHRPHAPTFFILVLLFVYPTPSLSFLRTVLCHPAHAPTLQSNRRLLSPAFSRSSISFSVPGVLKVRGGAAVKTLVLKDFSSSVLGFFGSIRVPSSFIAGAALAALFAIKPNSNLIGKKDVLKKILYNLCCASMFSAFACSMIILVISTVAYSSVLHARFDPVAETAYLLLKREFLFEFLTVRVCSFMSWMSFLVGICLRTTLEFELLEPDRRYIGCACISCFVGIVSYLFSYINQTLYCYGSSFEMIGVLLKMMWEKMYADAQVLQVISLLSFVLATVSMIMAFLTSRKENKNELRND